MIPRPFVSFAVVSAVLLACGCATSSYTTTPKGTYQLKRVFPMNTWETVVNRPIAATHKATVAGFKDLGIAPITNRVDQVSGLVDGMFADNMDVEVKLEAIAPEMTRIRVRCGMVGDQGRTEAIFNAISKNL